MLIKEFDFHILSIACDELHDYEETFTIVEEIENLTLRKRAEEELITWQSFIWTMKVTMMIRQQQNTWVQSQNNMVNNNVPHMVMTFSHT